MESEELRLKCLELAVSKSADPREALARADMFLEYVRREAPTPKPQPEIKKLDPSKRTDNSKILP